jgi:hypothetical protein
LIHGSHWVIDRELFVELLEGYKKLEEIIEELPDGAMKDARMKTVEEHVKVLMGWLEKGETVMEGEEEEGEDEDGDGVPRG